MATDETLVELEALSGDFVVTPPGCRCVADVRPCDGDRSSGHPCTSRSGRSPALRSQTRLCRDGGVPLHWPLSRVPYGAVMAGSPRQKLTGTDVTRIADLAFGAWKNAPCDGGTPSVEGFDDGPLASAPDASDCINSDSCDPFTHDVIVFDDDGWPYDDNTANPLALTTVSYGVKDGRIFEAKTEINSAEYAFTTATSSDAGNDAYDLQSVLTHEAGHFLGLAIFAI